MQIFTRALGVTEAELFKMMEQGQLLSAEVLPKVAAEFKKSAKEGGAYTLALQGLRVKEGQFMTGMQRAGKTIFNSGFEKGLANLYGTLSTMFENSEPQLKKLGKIFGDVFNGISIAIKVLEPIMKIAIDNFYTLVGAKAIFMVRGFVGALNAQSYIAARAWARMFAPVAAALVLVDELASLMDDSRLGLLEKSIGKQVNVKTGSISEFTEKNGKFYAKEGSSSKVSGLSMGFSAVSNAVQNMNPFHSVYNAATSASDLFQSGMTSGSAVYNHYQNTFNNTQADDVKRAVGAGVSAAQQPRGK